MANVLRTSSAARTAPVLAVLFDLGGVLLRLDYGAIVARAAQRGVQLEEAALAHAEAAARRAIDAYAAGRGGVRGTDAVRLPDYFDDLLGAAGVAARKRADLVAQLRADHADANLWRVPIAGAQRTLAARRRAGLRTGVVSNADGRAAALLEAAGLTSSLELVVDSHLEGVEKPDPEIFRRALARLDVPADRTVFVGDIWSIDVEGSRAAGLRPILMDETGSYASAPCERIRRLDELAERVGIGHGEREGSAR
jgi:putative hydrolase of the HAD superfamily